ncbi:hypothetical protein [Streptomyces coeruleorubidus]|uniref:Uncharacterized protein n=1 Tax=Streptomyces coeruleorubidus TaxID=116188 RepID=A0ABZ0KTQ3_STRC4|nr:hypothetical protein [Streptomyces coeruleorubidus]WOT40665.1 hypothetical protein R5U08_41990 [Streptomyces coeruleorubidus]
MKDALFERVNDRWKKRRDGWKDNVGQRGRRTKPSRNASERRGRQRPRTGAPGASGDDARRSGSGPNGSGHAGYGQARTSPFDQAGGDPVTFTVEQVDPPGTHAKRWEPAEIGQAPRGLPGQGQPALPWAPQRPAGKRPGTSRRKDPIPMPQTPARRGSAAVSAGVHATDITLDDALEALTKLVSDGMTTSDDADQLARQSNRLVAAVESINQDLAAAHNVKGKTTRAMETVMEGVTEVVRVAQRLAKKAHDAAEAAEAEENKMKRDYRPVQAATADAGLATPSARIHNEN